MDVRIIEGIASGARFVVPILLEQLDGYREELGDDPPLLDAAGMRVPIMVEIGERVGGPPDGACIRLAAKHHSERFPVFEGTLRVEPIDQLNSNLVLAGHYVVPLGLIGIVADRTLLAKSAKRSLGRLLARMKASLSAAVLHSIMGQ